MTEDQLEQEALSWLEDVGYVHLYGPDIAHDGPAPARTNYQQVHLPLRIRQAVDILNPDIPTAAREDAIKQVLDLGCLRCWVPTGISTVCWSLASRSSTRKTARPAATS